MTVRWRSAFAIALAALFTVLFAGPALAHATLLNATPGDSAVVETEPADIRLTYDEAVGTQAGAVKIIAPDGTRVESGEVSSTDGGRTVVAGLKPGLGEGTYTILWRVLSEDSHSIFGTSAFSIGHASSTVAGAFAEVEAGGGGAARDLLAVGRYLLYVGVVLLIGGLIFLQVLWPAGRTVAAVRRMLWVGFGLAVVATVGDLLFQGPYTAGQPLGSLWDPTLIGNTLGTRFGIATVIRLVLLAGLAAVLRSVGRVGRTPLAVAGGVLGAGILLSISALGHSGAGDLVALAMAADALHLAAMSGWIGGLAILGLVVLRRSPNEAAALLPRWSRFAMSCVGVLAVTGTFTAWRQVRQLDALVSTTYGVTLLIKLALVAIVLGFAGFGRYWVRRHFGVRAAVAVNSGVTAPATLVYSDGSTAIGHGPVRSSGAGIGDGLSPATTADGDARGNVRSIAGAIAVRRLRRSVLLETVVAAVILGVTSVLVATTPARDTYFPVFEQTVAATPELQVDITVDPARSGLNDLTFAFTSNGDPVDVVKASTRWTSQGGDYVVPAELTRVATGKYTATGLLLPSAGTWKLAVTTQTTDIDSTTVVLTVPIR